MASASPAVSARIVHKDEHLLVLDKPAFVPTTSPDGKNCLASLARELDATAPRMHPSSRLDAEVTGLVTFARTDRAIAALLEARKAGAYERCYVGLLSRPLDPPRGELRFSIGKDPRDARRRSALAEGDPAGIFARSRYEVLASARHVTLALLFPETGRTHQLRVHVAHAGAPLLGDKHYGGPTRVVLDDGRVVGLRRVMLHCLRLGLPNVAGQGRLLLEAPVPDDMLRVYEALGGSAADLSVARLHPSA